MNAHMLDVDGTILNTVVVENLSALPNLVSAAIGGCIGDRIVNGSVVKRQPKIPQVVPMLNAELALIEAGWYDDVQLFIASLPDKQMKRARAFMNKAQTMRRRHALILAYAASRNKTDAEIDALFVDADAMKVDD